MQYLTIIWISYLNCSPDSNIHCIVFIVSWQHIIIDVSCRLYWNKSINFAWNLYALIILNTFASCKYSLSLQVVSWQNIVMDANFILYWNMSINFAWNMYTLIEHTAYHCICHDKSTSYRVCIKTTSISSDMNCISGPAGRSIPNMYDHEDIDRGNWPGNGTIWLLIIIARAERIKYLYYVWSMSAWGSCLSLLTFDQSAMSYATNVFVWFLDE